MKSRLNLKPVQKGTKKLVEQYGKSLLYVRYRYDENRGVRLKTVEIVVEEKPWKPVSHLRDEDIIPIHVAYHEKTLREQLKAAGGRWDSEAKLWHIFVWCDSRARVGGKNSGGVSKTETQAIAYWVEA